MSCPTARKTDWSVSAMNFCLILPGALASFQFTKSLPFQQYNQPHVREDPPPFFRRGGSFTTDGLKTIFWSWDSEGSWAQFALLFWAGSCSISQYKKHLALKQRPQHFGGVCGQPGHCWASLCGTAVILVAVAHNSWPHHHLLHEAAAPCLPFAQRTGLGWSVLGYQLFHWLVHLCSSQSAIFGLGKHSFSQQR